MKPMIAAPRDMVERKPAHGSPCNRCGLCCYAVKCSLGKHIFGPAPGPCPALRLVDGGDGHTYECGIVGEATEDMREAAQLIIGAGDGCDARFNGEWRNVPFSDALRRLDYLRREEIKAALAIWGMEDEREMPF